MRGTDGTGQGKRKEPNLIFHSSSSCRRAAMEDSLVSGMGFNWGAKAREVGCAMQHVQAVFIPGGSS